MKKIDQRIVSRLNNTTKNNLRKMVDKVITIDEKKLSKMNKTKCIEHLKGFSFSQLVKLSNN